MRISFDKTLYGLGQIKLMQVASKDQHADIGTQAVDKQVRNRSVPMWLSEKSSGDMWVLGACGIEGNDVGSMESSDLSCLIFMIDLRGAGILAHLG